MPQLVIEDFKNGMDRTRPRANGIPGSLWRAENGVITRGGDFEKSKRFVETYELPAGQTFGMARVRGRLQVYASSPVAISPGVSLQSLAAPGGPDMTAVLDVKTPGGLAYVMAKYSDGSIHHFYDGARVSDWDALADDNASLTTIAEYLASEMQRDGAVDVVANGNVITVTARTPGTAFTLSATATNGALGADDQTADAGTVLPNVAAVANVDATGTITVTGGALQTGDAITVVTVDGTDLLGDDDIVDYSTSNSATATALAVKINALTDEHGFIAEAVGAVVTLRAPAGSGTTHNGDVVAVTTTGTTTVSTANMAGGVDDVEAVAQMATITLSGTVDANEYDDLWEVTLNGTTYNITTRGSAMGTYGLVHNSRIYIVANNIVVYCALNNFDDFHTGVGTEDGYGFFAPSNDSGNSQLVGLGKFQGRAAILAREDIATYFLPADATQGEIDQLIENTGTVAPGSVQSYGSHDMFYLDETGVRSLQPRDSSNAPFVSDVGSLIDEYVKEIRGSVAPATVINAASIIDPIDGRYWLAIGDKILTFSGFRDRKIVAWTVQDTDVTPTAFARIGRDVYMRAGDSIYRYGGADGEQYVSDTCVFETAFMDCGTPGTHKKFTGFDFSCKGLWEVKVMTDPEDDTKALTVCRVSSPTLNKLHINFQFEAAIFAIRATSLAEGPASFSKIIAHFKKVDAQ